jgi:hypothetical protein
MLLFVTLNALNVSACKIPVPVSAALEMTLAPLPSLD